MFGDFWKNFGLDFPFFGADPQGGMLGANAGPDQNLHMAGMGAPSGDLQSGSGGLGAPPGSQGPEMARSAPTASAVASAGGPGGASPLTVGGGANPLAGGQHTFGVGSGLESEAKELVGSILKAFGIENKGAMGRA